VRGYDASPVDFADWRGIAERTSAGSWLDDVRTLLWRDALGPANALLFVAAALGASVAWRERAALRWPLACAFAVQVGAACGWLGGIGTALPRMLALPAAFMGPFAAMAAGRAWNAAPQRWMRAALAAAAILCAVSWWNDGTRNAQTSVRYVRPEIALARALVERAGRPVRVVPRRGLGTRKRHDGCEALQGVSDLRQGTDFACDGWPGADALATEITAEWDADTRTYTFP
jgi:hypothetical protein